VRKESPWNCVLFGAPAAGERHGRGRRQAVFQPLEHRVVRWCRKGRRARRVMIRPPLRKGVGTRGNFLRKSDRRHGGDTSNNPPVTSASPGTIGPSNVRNTIPTRPTLQEKIKSPHQNSLEPRSGRVREPRMRRPLQGGAEPCASQTSMNRGVLGCDSLGVRTFTILVAAPPKHEDRVRVLDGDLMRTEEFG